MPDAITAVCGMVDLTYKKVRELEKKSRKRGRKGVDHLSLKSLELALESMAKGGAR
jgi:hypothetical protein